MGQYSPNLFAYAGSLDPASADFGPYMKSDPLPFFLSNISERNNDYSDNLDFRRGEVGVVTFFVLEVSDYKSAMLYLYIYKNVMRSRKRLPMLEKWILSFPPN